MYKFIEFYSKNIKANHIKIDNFINEFDKTEIKRILDHTDVNNFIELIVEKLKLVK